MLLNEYDLFIFAINNHTKEVLRVLEEPLRLGPSTTKYHSKISVEQANSGWLTLVLPYHHFLSPSGGKERVPQRPVTNAERREASTEIRQA